MDNYVTLGKYVKIPEKLFMFASENKTMLLIT